MQTLGPASGGAQSAAVQQPARVAPTVSAAGAALAAPVLAMPLILPAGAAAAQGAAEALPAPPNGQGRQPLAPAGRPVSPSALPEAKGRTAIAEQVEKGMRQHFPGMSDETLAQWHSNLEGTLAEAKAAHSAAKEGIKQVGHHASHLFKSCVRKTLTTRQAVVILMVDLFIG